MLEYVYSACVHEDAQIREMVNKTTSSPQLVESMGRYHHRIRQHIIRKEYRTFFFVSRSSALSARSLLLALALLEQSLRDENLVLSRNGATSCQSARKEKLLGYPSEELRHSR